tara:strand:+ start:613 stop:1182 length:570 start_codon:yes stop_codon:yes gene_type:complete
MKIEGNQIKIGNIIRHKDKLWKVYKTQHTQPGKGGAYLQAELKDIRNGTKLNERFRSSESVEKVYLEEKEYQYLYKDHNGYNFMNNETYEQITIKEVQISEIQKKFLKENLMIKIEIYDEEPISIKLPDTIILKVIATDAVIKGQTATSSYKPATLENDIKTNVPPHIVIDDKIIVNSNDGSYIEKAKN